MKKLLRGAGRLNYKVQQSLGGIIPLPREIYPPFTACRLHWSLRSRSQIHTFLPILNKKTLDTNFLRVYISFNFIKAVKRRVHEGRWQRELRLVRRSADEFVEDGL